LGQPSPSYEVEKETKMTIYTQRIFGLIVLVLLLMFLFTANAAYEKHSQQPQVIQMEPTDYAVIGIAFKI